MKILLVEDHEGTADRLSVLLSQADPRLQVSIAHTLSEGLMLSNELEPDITLLDLCLPDTKDWRETIAAIPLFKPPVIVVTDLCDPEVFEAAYLAKADHVFKKEVVIKLVSVLITSIIAARARRVARDSDYAS